MFSLLRFPLQVLTRFGDGITGARVASPLGSASRGNVEAEYEIAISADTAGFTRADARGCGR
jgi:hypothetical protein